MNWIRSKIRHWLGISSNETRLNELDSLYSDLVSIGVDVHFRGQPHMILIFSRLKGGQIREISAHFNSLQELNDLCKYLKDRYKPSSTFVDMPYGFRREFLGGF